MEPLERGKENDDDDDDDDDERIDEWEREEVKVEVEGKCC